MKRLVCGAFELLGLCRMRLGEPQSRSGVSAAPMTRVDDLAVRHALEAAGVEFIDENGGSPGVRLRGRLKGESRRK
jgi:hypothetical protein